MIARHHGIDVSPQQISTEYALDEPEPSVALLRRIAAEKGFKTEAADMTMASLRELGPAFPVMACLNNGNWVVVGGFRTGNGGDLRIVVLDPLASRPDLMMLEPGRFAERWSGKILLAKRRFALADENQPFGLKWFIPEILRQRSLFVNTAVAALLLHLVALALPIFFQLIIDKVLVHETYNTLYVLAIGVVAAILFDGAFQVLRRYLLLHASSKIDIRVATRTFSHMLRLPMDFFERGSAGVLVRHMQQAERVREFLTGRLFLTILDATVLVVFIPILLLYSPALTAVVLAFTVITALVVVALIGPFRTRLHALYQAESERQALLVETIHGMRTVKSLSMEPRQRRRWDNSAAQAVHLHYRVGKISAVAQTFTQVLEKLMMVAVIGLGAQMVFDGGLTVGALVAFNMLAGRVSQPLVQVVTLIHEYQEAALSVRMLGSVMNQPAEYTGGRGIRPPHIEGRLDFEGVTFRYGPDLSPALDSVSFRIPAGGVFGLVGRSGSGKTTITRIIQGLYSAQQGTVRVDGIDLREYELPYLRSHIGVVLQDNFLFRGTVRENIAAARPNASFEEIIDVARQAGADEFIERLPRGYDTMLEENGGNLSGGQKQRLAIARALLPNPRLLILDEATSALDPESEHIIRKNLRRIARNRTLIIVSHRLSFLTDADQILVMENGGIGGLGRHGDLLHDCPLYRRMWDQQHTEVA